MARHRDSPVGGLREAYFCDANNLGSDTQVTDYSGSVKTDFIYYPWQNWTNAGSMVDALFGGFEQGAGQDYKTPTRLYTGGLGRWLSPDPLGGSVTDPQSLYRYAYALNNPTTFTDPLGLQSGSWSPPWTGNCSANGYTTGCQWGGGAVSNTEGPTGCMAGEYACGQGLLDESPEQSAVGKLFEFATGLKFLMGSSAAGGSLSLGGVTYTWVSSYAMLTLPAGSDPRFYMKDTSHWEMAGALAIGGTAVCVAAEPCGALEGSSALMLGAAAAIGTTYYAYKNKDAIKNIVSLLNQVKLHTGDLNSNPNPDPRDHWRKEIRAFLKDARKWGKRMSPGKLQEFYMKMIDEAEAAVPED